MKKNFLRKVRTLGAVVLAGVVMMTGIWTPAGSAEGVKAAQVSIQATGADLNSAISLTPSKKWKTKMLKKENRGYYYKLTVNLPSVITLSVQNELSGIAGIRFWNSNGAQDAIISFRQNGGKTQKYQLCLDAGYYYLFLSKEEADDTGKIKVKYSQEVKELPYDSQENDRMATAADITAASSVEGMLTLGNLNDFYRYTYEKGKGKSIIFSNKTGGYLSIRVYEAAKLANGSYDEAVYQTQLNIRKGEKLQYDFEGNGGIFYFDVSGNETGIYTITPKKSVTSKKITLIGKNITLPLGETKKIIKSVTPADALEDSYEISSKNPKIVGVASRDSVTGCKVGKTKVTIYYGRDYTAIGQSYKHKIVCNITVTEAKAKKLKVSASKLSLVKGKTKQLKVKVLPAEADQRVTYKSSNSSVVKVSSNGKLTAQKEGMAKITITSASNPKVKTVVSVTVTPILVQKISFKKTSYDVKNGTVVKLGSLAQLAPANAKDKTIHWSSSNTNVVRVDANGNVTAVGAGTATITATSAGNSSVKAKLTFKVTSVIQSIAISDSTLSMEAGESKKLSAVLTPADTKYNGVQWRSSDPDVAKVDANGNVTAVGAGKATITATSTENANASAACVVTVTGKQQEKPEEITVSPSSGTIQEGKKASFTAALKPAGAKGTVTWSIADTTIAAIVSTDGNKVTVKGVSCGTTYLTATIGDIKKTVVITVQ